MNEKIIAGNASVSALYALQWEFPDLEAENLSFKVLNQVLEQTELSGPHKNNGKKLNRLYAITPIGIPEIFLEVDQRLVSWLAKKIKPALSRP